MIVLFWSRATRDLLKSFGWGIAATPSVRCSDEVATFPRRPPHSIFRFPATISLSPALCRAVARMDRRNVAGGGALQLVCHAASPPRSRLIRVGWVACRPHDRLLKYK